MEGVANVGPGEPISIALVVVFGGEHGGAAVVVCHGAATLVTTWVELGRRIEIVVDRPDSAFGSASLRQRQRRRMMGVCRVARAVRGEAFIFKGAVVARGFVEMRMAGSVDRVACSRGGHV